MPSPVFRMAYYLQHSVVLTLTHPVLLPTPAQVTDGAGVVMLMTRREALRRGLPIMGIFRSFAAVGVPPAVMGIGPAVAIPAAVEMAGLSIGDVDLFEINEAFASQVRLEWWVEATVAWCTGAAPTRGRANTARRLDGRVPFLFAMLFQRVMWW